MGGLECNEMGYALLCEGMIYSHRGEIIDWCVKKIFYVGKIFRLDFFYFHSKYGRVYLISSLKSEHNFPILLITNCLFKNKFNTCINRYFSTTIQQNIY